MPRKSSHIANLYTLFVDARKDLRYEFSNGVAITTNSDGEYRHVLEVEMPLGVEITHIFRIDACSGDSRSYYERYVEITPMRKFHASTVGWLKHLGNMKPSMMYSVDAIYTDNQSDRGKEDS